MCKAPAKEDIRWSSPIQAPTAPQIVLDCLSIIRTGYTTIALMRRLTVISTSGTGPILFLLRHPVELAVLVQKPALDLVLYPRRCGGRPGTQTMRSSLCIPI